MDFPSDLNNFIFDQAMEGMFQSSPQGRYLRVNQAMAKIFGYDSPLDMVNSVTDISLQIHASPKTWDEFQRILNEQESLQSFVVQNKRKDGTVIWTSTNAKTVRDPNENILYFFGFVQDITAIKQAEHALGETETRYRTLVEQVPAAVYIDTPTDNLNSGIYISPQIESISGYSPSEWTQTRGFWPSIIHPDDLERFIAENDRTNATGEAFDAEYRIHHKNGSIVWVRDMASLAKDANDSPLYWHGILIDVTEQKNFQDSLRLSEDRFRKVFEASPIAVCITIFENGEFIDVNESYLRLSEYRREELIGHTAVEMGFLSQAERAVWVAQFLAMGESVHGLDAKFKTASGKTLKTLDFYEAIEIGGRKAILSMFYDTTAQSKAAQALRESEERYRILVENIPAIVFLEPVNQSDGAFYINAQVESVLGYTPQEWLEDRDLWAKSLHPEDREHALNEEKRAEQYSGRFSLEYRLITKDARTVWVQEESTLIRDGDGVPLFWQGFLLDITNRKETQLALKQSEERFEKVFRANPLGVCITTLGDGLFIDVNEAYCQLTEYQKEELVGKTTVEMMLWDTDDDRSAVVQLLESSSAIREFNDKLRTRSGRILNILSFYELIELNGKPCILSMHYDTSSQREAQEALRESASAYRGLFDSVSDAIYIQDREGRFLDVNQGGEKMYGYPSEYFIGKNPEALSAPGRNDFDSLKLAIEKAFQGIPQEFEFWGIRKNGEIFPKEVRLYKGVFFGQDVVFALAQDITEKKRTAEALRRREAILEAIAYASEQFLKTDNWEICIPDILARLGLAGEASRAYIFRNKTGPHGGLLSDQIFEWCAPDIVPQAENADLQNFDFQIAGFSFFTEILGKGNIICDLVKNFPPAAQIELAREDILSMLVVPIMVNNTWWGFIGYDECDYERLWSQPEIEALKVASGILGAVIERSEVAHALTRSEEQYRMLIEQASDGIFIADIDGNLREVNPFGCTMLGYSHSELLMNNFFEIIDQNETTDEQTALLHMKIGDARTTERHLIRKDGSILSVEINAKILPDGRWQGIVRDITERKKASDARERQLKELSVLHELAIAGTRARNEDELIDQATDIIGYTLYPDILGFLLVTDSGDKFYPHPSYHGMSHPSTMREYQIGDGITGWVAKTGKSINVPDVRESENYIEINPNSRSELCVPMMIGDRVIGVINAESYKIGYFTSDDERLLLTISGQLATAIERLRSEQAEREQRALAEALRDIAETLNSTLEFNKIMDRILENIGRVVPSQVAAIMLVEDGIARCVRHRGYAQYNLSEWVDTLRIRCEDLPDFREALHTKQPLLIPDTEAEPTWIILPESKWIRSHLVAPILIDKTVIGFITLDHPTPGFFKKRDAERIVAFTNQAATALENARLFQAEQQRRHEAETLRDAAGVVAATLDSGLAVELILDQLARVLPYDSAAVQLLHNGYLEIVGGRGWSVDTSVLGMRFPVPGDNPNSKVVLEKKPLILNHASETYSPFREPPHSHIRSWMGVPLIAHGEVIGMLSVDSKRENYFNEEHIRLVTAFANQAAIAMENARLHEKTEGQIHRLTALRDVDTAIASSLDLRVTLGILLEHAMSQLNADALDIMIYNPNLQILELVAGVGFNGHIVRRQNRIGEGLAGKIALNRKTLQIQNLPDSLEYAGIGWLADEKIISYTGFPLLGKGQLKGVFEIYFRSAHTPNEDWMDFMQTLAGQAAIAIDNSQLFEKLQRSNQELSLAYDTTLEGWGLALELRDKETQGHTLRVTEMTIRLARKMGINDSDIKNIRRGVLLHDIGKMGVPDRILLKTDALDNDEWEKMRLHPQYAFDLLKQISYLRPAIDIPYCHHEKWDGTGYPRGLKETQIPLAARIFAVVDVWDALLSDRPYRKPWEKEKIIEYIKAETNTRFDPEVVRVFLELISEEK